MSRLIIGFLLGVLSTLAAVFLFLGQPSEIPEGTRPSTSEEVSGVRRTIPAQGAVQPTEEGDDDSHRPMSVEPASAEARLPSQPEWGTAPQQPVRSPAAAGEPSAQAKETRYPREIAEMIENRVDKELQARYENDEREESWATYMEGQLGGYFARKPSLAQFNISMIDCRTSVCSVHVLGYGQDALTLWNTATADLVSQPWFEFSNMSMNRRNPEPGILAIVLILTRKPPE